MRYRFAWALMALPLAACVADSREPPTVSMYLERDLDAVQTHHAKSDYPIPKHTMRFAIPPTIYVAKPAPRPLIFAVAETVGILNDMLPPSFQVVWGGAWLGDEGDLVHAMEEGTGDIIIGAIPHRHWPKASRSYDKMVAFAFYPPPDPAPILNGGLVVVDLERAAKMDVPLTAIIVHEVLHVFGRAHSDFRDSIMHEDLEGLDPSPPYVREIDVRVMQAIYRAR